MMSENGTLRSKRPQLTDSITKLDEVIDGLATAIPSAVADSIGEVLGPAFTVAIKDAMKQAVAEVLKERNNEEKPTPVPPPTVPLTPAPPKPSPWMKVKAALTQLKTWALKKAAPVVARAALGWAVVRVIGVSTIHSRTAILTTTLTGTLTGLAGSPWGRSARRFCWRFRRVRSRRRLPGQHPLSAYWLPSRKIDRATESPAKTVIQTRIGLPSRRTALGTFPLALTSRPYSGGST